ncbi:MAG: amidohydrolase family protein [SAR324 cluster bacterium]|nr:amidohydrolase family protein [SAR324 cluster bacterium]
MKAIALPAVFTMTLWACLAAPGPIAQAERLTQSAPALPIIDVHLHYSREAWAEFSPDTVQQKLAEANVPRALLSSSPDDGTLRLHSLNPKRFVPMLRPYRAGVGLGDWARDAATPAYLAGRLGKGIYKGIGEFHLWDEDDARTPVLRKVARMAVARNIHLHVHSGAGPVRVLFELEPRLRILWAHAGLVTPPRQVGAMMERHANLWADLSFRASEIMPGATLDPAWRRLLLAHPKRFMIGSDSYTNSRWRVYGAILAGHRAWLDLLPREVSQAIAHGNAVRVFGLKLDD